MRAGWRDRPGLIPTTGSWCGKSCHCCCGRNISARAATVLPAPVRNQWCMCAISAATTMRWCGPPSATTSVMCPRRPTWWRIAIRWCTDRSTQLRASLISVRISRLQACLQRFLLVAPGFEKRTDHLTAFLRQTIPLKLHRMIQLRLLEETLRTYYSPRFWLHCAEHYPRDERMHDGTCTHGTGFNRHIQGGTRQTVIFFPGTGSTQRSNFRVGSGIATGNGMIETFTEHDAVAHDHRTDRHFMNIRCAIGQLQCTTHPVFVGGGRMGGGMGGRIGHGHFQNGVAAHSLPPDL